MIASGHGAAGPGIRKGEAMHLENTSNFPMDLPAAKRRVMGDTAFLLELLASFGESIPEILDCLCRSLEGRDGQTLSRTAHQLKGAASNLGAVRVAENASVLNELGRREDYPGASGALDALKRSVVELEAFMQQDLLQVLDAEEDDNENTHCG
jgi:HPt (histidine-containing phosphotransfer) domain-containing protein